MQSALFKTSAVGNEPHQILGVFKCFGKNYSCHPQGEYIYIYIGRSMLVVSCRAGVGGALNVMKLIGGSEDLVERQP